MSPRVKAFLVVPPLCALLGALLALPQVVHTFDRGHASVSVGQIAEGSAASRNVTVTALTFVDRGLRETVTREKSQVSPRISFFMPLADPGDEAAPTRVVVHTYSNEVFDAAERPGQPLTFEAVVRDVAWEGLSSEMKRALNALHPLAADAKLLEVRGVGTRSDLLWAVAGPMLGLIIGLFVAANLRPRPAGATT